MRALGARFAVVAAPRPAARHRDAPARGPADAVEHVDTDEPDNDNRDGGRADHPTHRRRRIEQCPHSTPETTSTTSIPSNTGVRAPTRNVNGREQRLGRATRQPSAPEVAARREGPQTAFRVCRLLQGEWDEARCQRAGRLLRVTLLLSVCCPAKAARRVGAGCVLRADRPRVSMVWTPDLF